MGGCQVKVTNTIDTFMSRISKDEKGCWLWVGTVFPTGYARFNYKGRGFRAHKFAYEHFVGPVPDGLVIDHLCRVRHCVNPHHLEAVTQRVNFERGISPQVSRARLTGLTHCKHGHRIDADGAYLYGGMRKCKKCAVRRTQEYRLRLKNAA